MPNGYTIYHYADGRVGTTYSGPSMLRVCEEDVQCGPYENTTLERADLHIREFRPKVIWYRPPVFGWKTLSRTEQSKYWSRFYYYEEVV